MTLEQFDIRMSIHTNSICADYRALLESGVELGTYDEGNMAHTLECKFRVFGKKDLGSDNGTPNR